MREGSGRSRPGISPLLRPAPRDVKLNGSGIAVMILSVALAVGGLWVGTEIFRRAQQSRRIAASLPLQAVTTEARVVRAQPREDRRTRLDYEYSVAGSSYTGSATVRGSDQQRRYGVGSTADVTYLASDPAVSWLRGQEPSPAPWWPVPAIPAGALAVAVMLLKTIRRQLDLLGHGRAAHAVVTKVQKKRSDQGAYWRVEYEWRLLSGARRTAKYNHRRKPEPLVGAQIPIVYDSERPSRNHRYPLSLVTIA